MRRKSPGNKAAMKRRPGMGMKKLRNRSNRQSLARSRRTSPAGVSNVSFTPAPRRPWNLLTREPMTTRR